jgi:hypothetical protein
MSHKAVLDAKLSGWKLGVHLPAQGIGSKYVAAIGYASKLL